MFRGVKTNFVKFGWQGSEDKKNCVLVLKRCEIERRESRDRGWKSRDDGYAYGYRCRGQSSIDGRCLERCGSRSSRGSPCCPRRDEGGSDEGFFGSE